MIKKYLDLSTEHLSKDEWDRVEASEEVPVVSLIFTSHQYGCWVWVAPADADYDELREKFPILSKVMDYARERDCAWINFDQDASFVDDLPSFDW